LALSLGGDRRKPGKPKMHTEGLVGEFLVQETKGGGTEDKFAHALSNLSQRLSSPNAVLLDRPIISPRDWIEDAYYSGPLKREAWPQKIKDFVTVARGNVTEVVVTGCIGWGKSWMMKAVCAYDLYRLSCIKEPQLALGIGSSETIVMVLVSMNVTKSRAKLLTPLKTMLEMTPYFRDHFRFDPRKETVLDFPKNIRVLSGVTGESAVHSEDVIFLGVSECNFLPVVTNSKKKRGVDTLDVAADLVEATIRRMKSRFQQGAGQMPLARLVLDSSRQYPDDYLERRTKEIEAGKVGHECAVISRSIWEAKAGVLNANGDPYFGGDTFPVEVGCNNQFSRMLDETEIPFAKGDVIDVPMELREEFDRDIEGALRDFAGIAVMSLRPLISNRIALMECIRTTDTGKPEHACTHPFTATSTTLQDAVRILEQVLIDPATNKPRVNPKAPRTVHIDVGLTTDCLGFAMGHVEGMVKVSRGGKGTDDLACTVCRGDTNKQCERCFGKGKVKHFGHQVKCSQCSGKGIVPCGACGGTGKHGVAVVRPKIYMDILLQVTPPENAQIQFDDVEALLTQLRQWGYYIPAVTADGYNSDQFLQRQVSKYGAGFAKKLSVDRPKDAYYTLRDAIYDTDEDGDRRLSFYAYDPFVREITNVEDRPDKVDHPPKGSKDVSDAVAGVVYNCDRLTALQVSYSGSHVNVKTF
jgi:hypothetical protein